MGAGGGWACHRGLGAPGPAGPAKVGLRGWVGGLYCPGFSSPPDLVWTPASPPHLICIHPQPPLLMCIHLQPAVPPPLAYICSPPPLTYAPPTPLAYICSPPPTHLCPPPPLSHTFAVPPPLTYAPPLPSRIHLQPPLGRVLSSVPLLCLAVYHPPSGTMPGPHLPSPELPPPPPQQAAYIARVTLEVGAGERGRTYPRRGGRCWAE